jgi:transketolase
VEVAECYEIALRYNGPSAFALSRQELPQLRVSVGENYSSKGAYVLHEPNGQRDITLIATGSEVALALKSKEMLQEKGVRAAVVSMPCMELFEEQDEVYQCRVLGEAPRLIIEAASPFGWHKWMGNNDGIIAMNGFGCSAPGAQLFEKYGFTVHHVVDEALKIIKK